MRVLETTLLTGPYDWDERALPRGDYEARLDRVRAAMEEAGADMLAVFGHPGNYAALSYLTNFTPKNGPAMALVPREGAPRVLASGTPKMMDAAKRLTWVEDVRPLGNAPKTVAEFIGEIDTLATWAFGAVPNAIYDGIAGAVAPGTLLALDGALDPLRRRKSPHELELMRGAAKFLGIAADAFAANIRAGAGVRSAALAAERAAIAAGAQDARAMASLSPGGVPLPLDEASDERLLNPANAGIAAQNFGYWASGYLTVGNDSLRAKARDALSAALAGAKAGVHLPDGVAANAIGLSLEEGPGDPLEAGVAYAVTASATADGQTAYASALIAVTKDGCETLWQGEAA